MGDVERHSIRAFDGAGLADQGRDAAVDQVISAVTKTMSLADCFAAALAKTRNAELVTGDREFKVIESELKKIRWLK